MDLNLKGRVAVVTGAGAGIGEAIAGALASEECSVWLADRDRAAATSAATALSSHGHAATALVVDVADAAAVFAAFAQVEKTAGRLDILSTRPASFRPVGLPTSPLRNGIALRASMSRESSIA